MKKFLTCIFTIMTICMTLTGIYATTGIIDKDYTDNVYKFSENGDIKLPFFRISSDRMIIDKDVSKSGLSYARNGINVDNNLNGIQVLCSSDTVRITGNMEYGVVMAPTVIIQGTITKSLMIVANSITVDKNATIKEDLLCSTSKLDLLGNVEGNVLGMISEANISGTISQDFRAKIDNILLNDGSSIKGNVYIDTYNTNINVKDKYPNATINIMQKPNQGFNINIWNALKTAVLFGFIYILLSSKTKIISNALIKVKSHMPSTALFGFATMLLLPLIIFVCFILTMLTFGIITVPIMIVYAAFIFVSFILSTFVVGSIMSEYMANKYSDRLKGFWYKLTSAICIFFVLCILVSIPEVGYILALALCMLSAGILITTIFRRV